MITNRLLRIDQDLDRLDLILNQLEQFNGTINMTSVEELERRLQQLNNTAASLSREAAQSLAQLRQDVAVIDAASAQIVALNSTAESIIQGNLTEGESRLEPIAMLLDAISSTYATLRRNLTDLDVRAGRLGQSLVELSARADSLANGLVAANSSLGALSEEVERRSREVEVLMALVQALNESLLSLERVSNDAESRAGSLAVRENRKLYSKIATYRSFPLAHKSSHASLQSFPSVYLSLSPLFSNYLNLLLHFRMLLR